MYRMTCDGHPLLDFRDDDYILGSPRVKTKVNTVCEGSFKIYFNHPNYDKLIPLKSIFEVTDEYGVLFRGRMTEDTKDIKNGKDVDLEGALSYFNDSVVRPYVFPDDFEEDAEYIAAKAETPEQAAIDGGVVRFFLKWLIDRHNEQVEPFQQFKLGNVTVYDKNNVIERAASDYPSTWAELDKKLFNSSLGGFLCIRYEEDGNYIDYLREFTEINEQGITYGENMLDISQNNNANETYSAVIPLGASSTTTTSNGEVYEGMYGDIVGGSTSEKRLTIESVNDRYITNDIVKVGDMIYSKKARQAYGLRIAPREDTTWDDVKDADNLQTKGIEYLCGGILQIPTSFKVTAVDMHCTDSQIRSIRIYKKIPVYTPAHSLNDNFDLDELELDLLNAQNTKINVGKTVTTLTEYQSKAQNKIQNVLSNYATNKKVDSALKNTATIIEKDYAKKGEVLSQEQIQTLINQALAASGFVTENDLNLKLEDYMTENEVQDLIDNTINGGDDTPEECEHVWGEWVYNIANSCLKQSSKRRTCTICGATEIENYVDDSSHNWGEGTYTAPTCTESGYMTYTCNDCHTTRQAFVANAHGHSWGDDGNSEVCTICGADRSEQN